MMNLMKYFLVILPFLILFSYYLFHLSSKIIKAIFFIVIAINLLLVLYYGMSYGCEITSAPLYAYILANTYPHIVSLIISLMICFIKK